MKKIFIIVMVLAVGFTSCDMKDNYENEMSKVVDASGEWYVQYGISLDTLDVDGLGHLELLTYNTAADDNTMWITDNGKFWDYKVKVDVDVENLTFSGDAASVVPSYNINIKITNGKIFKGVKLMPSGAYTDSISFNIVFEDDAAATTYLATGYRHTGFSEDAVN